jgi:hypothetical protein
MSIFTKDKIYVSADRRTYLQWDEGDQKLYLYVQDVAVGYYTSSAFVPTYGVAAGGGFSASPRLVCTGNNPAMVSTDGTDSTPVTTETYIAEVFVPCNMTITGIGFFNGSAVAGNIKGILYDSTGAVVGQTASTAASGTDAYQKIALSSSYAAKGPATYYVGLQCNNVAMRFKTHTLGTFGASKKTGETYGTATAITPPTTFTTALGPIANLY